MKTKLSESHSNQRKLVNTRLKFQENNTQLSYNKDYHISRTPLVESAKNNLTLVKLLLSKLFQEINSTTQSKLPQKFYLKLELASKFKVKNNNLKLPYYNQPFLKTRIRSSTRSNQIKLVNMYSMLTFKEIISSANNVSPLLNQLNQTLRQLSWSSLAQCQIHSSHSQLSLLREIVTQDQFTEFT